MIVTNKSGTPSSNIELFGIPGRVSVRIRSRESTCSAAAAGKQAKGEKIQCCEAKIHNNRKKGSNFPLEAKNHHLFSLYIHNPTAKYLLYFI